MNRLGTGDEQAHRGSATGDVIVLGRVGNGERWYGKAMFGADTKRNPARYQKSKRGAAVDEPGYKWGGLDNLLEVVEYK